MATHSLIGKLDPDGTIRAVYCHWDGHPVHQLPMLKNYDTDEAVHALLDLGELSSLGPTLETCCAYKRDRNDLDASPAWEFEDLDELQKEAKVRYAPYIYLFQGGGWSVVSGNFFQPD